MRRIKAYFDAYCVLPDYDSPDTGPWKATIVPVDTIDWIDMEQFPVIEVTEAEYQEFVALKKRLAELQALFYERSENVRYGKDEENAA